MAKPVVVKVTAPTSGTGLYLVEDEKPTSSSRQWISAKAFQIMKRADKTVMFFNAYWNDITDEWDIISQTTKKW